jgi:pimeloyl-ACP methyl ester carboxylesterase
MSDIAGHLASAIEHDLGQPVFLQGTSTGGSVALQLAVDRPDLVRRLVVVRRAAPPRPPTSPSASCSRASPAR